MVHIGWWGRMMARRSERRTRIGERNSSSRRLNSLVTTINVSFIAMRMLMLILMLMIVIMHTRS